VLAMARYECHYYSMASYNAIITQKMGKLLIGKCILVNAVGAMDLKVCPVLKLTTMSAYDHAM